MVRPLTFYRKYIRPSTLYYTYVQRLYRKGKHPKPGTLFYSEVLAKEVSNLYRPWEGLK